MKPLAMLAIAMTVVSTGTVIEIPDKMVVAIFSQTCLDSVAGAPVVDCGTATAVVPALVPGGPLIGRAKSGDCFRWDYVNNNGTVPKSVGDYIKCQ